MTATDPAALQAAGRVGYDALDDYIVWVKQTKAAIAALPREPLLAFRVHPAIQRHGVWLEFGVAHGTSLRLLANERGEARLFGFDSFAGLPEDWRPGYPRGHFAVANPPAIEGAEIVVGLFEDTLHGFVPPGPITFVHVDSDVYSSAITVLLWLEKQEMAPGAVIEFDELVGYGGCEAHELRALYEAEQRGLRYRWLAQNGEQVAIEVLQS